MSDVRLIGRFRGAGSVEEITTAGRWLLCSRDYLRNASLLATVLSGGSVYDSYPVANALDGNRQSFLATSDNCAWIQITLDTGVTARKALLFIEYPDGEEIVPLAVEFSNDPNATWHDVYSAMTCLYRSSRFSLWKLPFDTTVSGGSSVKTIVTTGDVSLTLTPHTEADSFWIGGVAIPQTGPNVGIPRTIVGWTSSSGTVKLESPWAEQCAVGVQLWFQKIAENYLSNRFLRIKLGARWHSTMGPLHLVGLSAFDYYAELKGDMGRYRAFRAPNPSAVNSSVANPGGIVHEQLNGNCRFEQLGGPKRQFAATWEAVNPGWIDFLEAWAAQGLIGIVDHQRRYLQGRIDGNIGWDALMADADFGNEVAAKWSFKEI